MHKMHIGREQYANLSNVNPRKENFGDELINAADLKLKVTVGKAKALELFVEPESAEQQLWDENGVVRDEEFVLDLSSTHKHQALTVKGTKHKKMSFDPCTVKLQQAIPRHAHSLEVTLTAQVYPELADIGALCDMQKEDVKITIKNSSRPEEPQTDIED